MLRRYKSVALIVAWLFILFSGVGFAQDPSLETEMQSSLKELKTLAGQLLASNSPTTEDVERIQALAQQIEVNHLLLSDRFDTRTDQLASISGDASARNDAMKLAYTKTIANLLDILTDIEAPDDLSRSVLTDILDILNKALPRKERPIFGALPYKHLNYPATLPAYEPAIDPAYWIGNQASTDEDLQSYPEARITREIAELAESLEWHPIAIYHWVKNNIATEWYYGCMKGAEQTLAQKSGNDADQATLLVALLRASGFPSRYVKGVIEFNSKIDGVKKVFDVDDANQIALLLQKAGIPFEPVIKAGRIANFRLEHLWVETFVPMSNYRGAMLDEQGKAWNPLDTSIKQKGYTQNTPLAVLPELSLDAFADRYLETARQQTPLELLTSEATAWLSQNQPDAGFEDLLLVRTLIDENLGLLPSTTQFLPVAHTGEFAAMPDELIHKVRFKATKEGTVLFDQTVNAYELSSKQVLLDYEPETVEDQEVINSYGGMGNTPSYLVRLRPVVKVDDDRIAVGRDGMAIGDTFTMAIELVSPNGTQHIENTHINGNLSAIGIVCQDVVMPGEMADEEKTGARLLYEEALNYIDRWNASEQQLASLLQVERIRPVPTVVNLGGVLDVTWLMDTPHQVEWQGLYMDADLRAVEGIPARRMEDVSLDRTALFTRLSGLQGSVLENRLFEDDFGVGTISTAKLFGHAAQAGIPILTIDKANIGTALPTLAFADNIKTDITNAVNQGLVVRIPQSEMAYEDWAGIGYIKQNPATFEAGYMLSGGIAGGMTAWGYQRWKEHSAKWFKRLSSGYTGDVSDDADSACYIQKISAYKSEAVVGTTVSLQVMVRDSLLRPVPEAPVTFTVTSGGGNFGVGPDNKPLVTRIVSTEDNGIATIDFTLGVSTSANPSFVKKEGYTYGQQTGINLVDASLANDVMIHSPFTVYGLPDKPVKTERIASSPGCDDILDYAGYVGVRVLDKHDNPASNLPVAFTASINGPRPLLLVPFDAPCCMGGNVPVYGQCGSQGDDLPPIYTSYKGAVAGIIMGGTPNTSHTVTATCGAVTDPEEKTKQFSLTSCGVSEGDIALSGFYYGGNVDACEAGASFPSLARCYVYEKDEDEQFQIRHFDGSVTFEGIAGRSMGNYLYTAEVPIDTVGHQDITIKAKQDGETRQTVTLTVCGVDLRLINPDGTDLTEAYVPVDEINASTRGLVLRYKVTPADYIPSNAYIQIIRGRNPFAWLVPIKESPGIYTATLPRGTAFIPGIAHPARVVLNYGAAPPLEMWDPDQDNPGIPVYGVLADIDADLYNTGQPNEDDPDEHMTGLLIQVNSPDLKAVELASEIHSGSMTLTASNLPPTEPDQIQGRVKIWGSPDKTDLLIDMAAGDTTETWEVAGEARQTVYVEGITTSGTHADIDLTLNVTNDDGDIVADDLLKVTVCDISIVTDFNRDRKIDDADKQAGANGDTFYFWLNDDNDLEDAPDTDPVTLFGNDDIPALPGGYIMQDRENDIVDNKRDLIDFFPVQIMVTPVGILDLPNMDLALQTEQGAVNIAYTAIPDGAHAGDYLTDPDTATALQAATTFKVVTDTEYIINNSSFIRQLNTTGQGILITEGAAAISFDEDNNPADKKKSLVLRFMHGDNTLVENKLNLSINTVTTMFRHKNLRDDIGESILYSDRLEEPVNWPDNLLLNTNFVFIHGYNVNELQAQGWHAEFFKKLFWAGSRARFHAVTWYGSDGQEFLPYYGHKTPDYHGNVLHAFQTAPLLAAYLGGLPPDDRVILAAHSLGNMVACETVRLAPANVNLYFMLNAAVASESIDPAQYEENMPHKNWLPYEGLTDLYASEWYNRFENTPGDKRADLTWRGRFSAPAIVSKIINVYSSGDQVFEGQDKDEYPGIDQGPSVPMKVRHLPLEKLV